MKKLITILLSLMICAGCFGAAAEDIPVTEEMPVGGLSLRCPQAFIDAEGIIGTDGTMHLTDSVYLTYWYYIAANQEEFNSLLAENSGELSNRAALMFYVFSVGGDKDFTTVCSEIAENAGIDFSAENATEIGQAEDWKFYLYMNQDPGFEAEVDQKYMDEYTALLGRKEEIASAFTCSVPFNEYGEMDGKVIRFEAMDLEGNVVSSEEIFAQHEITMVNIWATWCGPCISELGELQALHTRFLEKDCAVLGLLTDQDTEKAGKLMAENGITYQVVLAPETFSSIFPFEAIPTTFFVDRSGAFLGTKIQGAYPDMYEDALQPLLEQVQQANP